MCMITNNQDAKILADKFHLILLVHHNGYAILEDIDFDLFYFARIDIHLKPLVIYDGSKELVQEVMSEFILTNKLMLNLLEY